MRPEDDERPADEEPALDGMERLIGRAPCPAVLAGRRVVAEHEVVARLEREGIISGYTLRLRPDAAREEVRAWTSIAVEGNQLKVVHALLGEPGVAALHDTNGRWDLLAELRVRDLTELSAALERIRAMPGVSATETSLHLKSWRA